jgi:hypothetical protein
MTCTSHSWFVVYILYVYADKTTFLGGDDDYANENATIFPCHEQGRFSQGFSSASPLSASAPGAIGMGRGFVVRVVTAFPDWFVCVRVGSEPGRSLLSLAAAFQANLHKSTLTIAKRVKVASVPFSNTAKTSPSHCIFHCTLQLKFHAHTAVL